MEIEFQTDVGRKRKMNQDYVGVFASQQGIVLAVLADGMGGHQAGDVASQLAVDFFGSKWQKSSITTSKDVESWLRKVLQETNEKICEEGEQHPQYGGMGTTLVCAALLAKTVVIANIGDSRAYLIHEKEIKQLTEDHSLVNELVKIGELTPEMAANHPRKNVLVRSLGIPRIIESDIEEHEIEMGDYLLLCSDGLTNMVSESDILQTIESDESVRQKVNQLIDKANNAGGTDNITALVIYNDLKEDNQ